MGLLLLLAISLVVIVVSRVQHNFREFRTILGHLSSLLEPQDTVTSPIHESIPKNDAASQQSSPLRSHLQAKPQLLSRYQVESAYPTETWQRQSYDSFVGTLVAKSLVFPCIYAAKGFKANEQRFLFLDSDDLSSFSNVSAVASALTEYLPQSRQIGANTSLVILCNQTQHFRSVQEYHDIFWNFLKSLRSLDHVPWPADFPEDIDSDNWCFCFNGMPSFIVVQTPAHEQRQSRYAPNLRVVIQPKWIFDVLFSTSKKRAGALKTVRELLRDYDSVSLSPYLKNFGEEGSRESQQYFLLDENTPGLCPYKTLTV